MKQFNNLYALSKTLRFELKPQGKTQENIGNKQLITQDDTRALQYKKAKIIIDDYHRMFINKTLQQIHLEYEQINDLNNLFFKYFNSSKTNKTKEEIEKEKIEKDNNIAKVKKVKNNLRKDIVTVFSNQEQYKSLFKKELFANDLNDFIDANKDYTNEQKDEHKNTIDDFKKFHTYFSGFNENRKNIYSSDEKTTALSYRIIDDNLIIFLKNIKLYEKIIKQYPELKEEFKKLENDKQNIFNGVVLDTFFNLSYFNNCLSQQQIEFYNLIIGGKKEESTQTKGINNYLNEFRQINKLKKSQLPDFITLKKQILSISQSSSFVVDDFKSDDDLIKSVNDICNNIQNNNIFDRLKEHFKHFDNFDTDNIVLKSDNIKEVSVNIYGGYDEIHTSLGEWFSHNDTSKTPKQKQAKQEKYLKQKYFTLSDIENALSKSNNKECSENIVFSHINKWGIKHNNELNCDMDIFDNINNSYKDLKVLFKSDKKLKENLSIQK